MKHRILGIGIATVDVIAETDLPLPSDGYVPMLGRTRQIGGIVGNALVAAARLGADVAWAGKVGGDDEGRFILDEMRKEGIDVSRALVDAAASTPFCFIVADRKLGTRGIAVDHGCSHNPYGADLPDDFLSGVDAIHLDGYYLDAALDAARRARALGIKVSLDASPFFKDLHSSLDYVDIFIASNAIAEELTGESEPRAMVRGLSGMGPEIVGVTLGERGSMAMVRGGEIVHAPAFEIQAVDTTAAGDAFHGAFLVGRLSGWPLERILTFSNAVSAVKCLTPGGGRGIPDFERTVNFLRSRGKDF